MKLSDYVMQFIARQGIEHIFYLPGGGAMHLVDSLGKLKDVESVCCLHEQAVAIAAQSYAMHTNHLGVGLVTTGPGGTNAITGVCAAWIDSVPCLFVSGQVKRSDMMTGKRLRQLGIQEADIIAMVHSITKYAITVKEPSSIRYHLEKALYLAKNGRPGPVWLDIPLDVQGTIIDETALEGFNTAEIKQKKPEASFIKKAVGKIFGYLNKSERPIIIAGDGIKISKSKDLFLEIINHLDVPSFPPGRPWICFMKNMDYMRGDVESWANVPPISRCKIPICFYASVQNWILPKRVLTPNLLPAPPKKLSLILIKMKLRNWISK